MKEGIRISELRMEREIVKGSQRGCLVEGRNGELSYRWEIARKERELGESKFGVGHEVGMMRS